MPRYLVPASAFEGDTLRVDGHLARHLARSLRVIHGERITVVDDAGVEHGVVIDQVSARLLTARVAWSRPAAGEPALQLHVVHALIREFADVVADLTHAGATAIYPVLTSRTVVRPPANRCRGQVERWQTVAAEAAQLAGRVRAPAVSTVGRLADAMAALPERTRILACTVDAQAPLSRIDIDTAAPLALVIGPEGGLEAAELAELMARGATSVHLGPRVHPARNAGSLALSLALARTGCLDHAPPPPPWPG
ncbi:MAG: RsmE family RNA methyltransferase [Candidatus Dormibacteria bacterium]